MLPSYKHHKKKGHNFVLGTKVGVEHVHVSDTAFTAFSTTSVGPGNKKSST